MSENKTVSESYAKRVAEIKALKVDDNILSGKSMHYTPEEEQKIIEATKPGAERDFGIGRTTGMVDELKKMGVQISSDNYADVISRASLSDDAEAYQDYQKKVLDKITALTEPPYTTQIIGNVETKVYPANYFNSDALALKWFCESVHFDKEICDELLFNVNGNEFRVSVTNIGLATLAHWRCK